MELVTREHFAKIERPMMEAGFKPEDVKREISFAIQHINKSKMLQECTPESKLIAVMNISNIGLSLNPASKEAYLIPRWNNIAKKMEAVLEPSYCGLVKLLTDSGSVTSLVAQLVCENDTLEMDMADNRNPVKHKISLDKSKRGNIQGVYALATLSDGTRQVEWMDIIEVQEIRERSEAYKAVKAGKLATCTWDTDFGEMMRKTVVKRIYKYLPRTDRMKYMDEAVKQDNTDYVASDDQLSYIENLLHTSTYDERQRNQIEMETAVMSSQRASQVIIQLKDNQQGLDQGMAGNQKEISNHIRKISQQ